MKPRNGTNKSCTPGTWVVIRLSVTVNNNRCFQQIISYDSPRGGVSVVTEKGETTTSFLLIQQARPSDSGTYQCNPSNAQSKSIVVHVLNGKYLQPSDIKRNTSTLVLFLSLSLYSLRSFYSLNSALRRVGVSDLICTDSYFVEIRF